MALETGTYLSDLIITNPTGSDQKSQGDDHLRLIKSVIKTSLADVDAVVGTIHSGATEPASPVTSQTLWNDTANNLLFIRNDAGTGWDGINADTVDGLEASQFLRNDANDTAIGNYEFYATDTTGVYNTSAIELREVNAVGGAESAAAYAPALAFHWGEVVQNQLALESDGVLHVRNGTDHTSAAMKCSTMQLTVINLGGTVLTPIAAEYNLLDGETDLHPTGTESAQGELELATNAETITGTDTVRACHPAGVAAAITAAGVGTMIILDTPESLGNVTTLGSWVSFTTSTLSGAGATSAIVAIKGSCSSTTATYATLSVDLRNPDSAIALGNSIVRRLQTQSSESASTSLYPNVGGEFTVNLSSTYNLDVGAAMATDGTAGTPAINIVLVGYYT